MKFIYFIFFYLLFASFLSANDKLNLNPFISQAPSEYHDSKVFNKYHPLIDFVDAHSKKNHFKNDFFGFRNEYNFYFSEMSSPLILMTGGSECAGYSHEKKTISDNLKNKLILHFKKNIEVMNLCQNSYTLSNEINSFIHLAYHLKPKIIISHSGWNDIFYGLYLNKSFLDIGFIYNKDLEYLTSIIYDSKSIFNFFDNNQVDIYQDWNPEKSSLLIDGLIKKIDVFKSIVSSNNSEFIYGLQGYNKNYIGKKTSFPDFFKTIHETHTELSNQLKKSNINYVNFQEMNNVEFVDSVHTTQESVEYISDRYFRYILTNFSDILN